MKFVLCRKIIKIEKIYTYTFQVIQYHYLCDPNTRWSEMISFDLRWPHEDHHVIQTLTDKSSQNMLSLNHSNDYHCQNVGFKPTDLSADIWLDND